MLFRKTVNRIGEARIRVKISNRLKGSSSYSSINGWALIDTGCGRTCIYEGVAKSLHLPQGMWEQVYLADGTRYYAPTYGASLEVIGIPSSRRVMRLGGMPSRLGCLDGQWIICLIGTDYLQYCRFVYEGRTFSLDVRA